MSRKRKHPGYQELLRRNRTQAEHIDALSREYRGRHQNLDLAAAALQGNRIAFETAAAEVATDGRRLQERYVWGFWRRVRFAVTGR